MIQHRLRPALFVAALLLVGTSSALRAEDYATTTFAGAANVTSGGDGTPGSFNNPYAVAIDAAKNVYVADTLNNTIRKITPQRVVSTLAGVAGQFGSADGAGSAARFNFPVGVAVDGAGNVFVADSKNFTIRKITPAGVVSTFAGAAFQFGATDGPGASARFFLPYGVAVDGAGNVYVADGGNHTIRKITPDGTVSTLAGAAQQQGSVNGTGGAARFASPFGVAVDAGGNVYVADSENHAIRRITPAGVVTTVAGQLGLSGAVDGGASVARFNQPRGVALDAAGNLFVVDHGNSVIRHVATNGNVTTIIGTAGVVGEVDSVGAAARVYSPTGIAADNTTIYIADTANNLIRRGVPASTAPLPVVAIQPFDQEVSAGQSVSFSVSATGTNVTYQWLRNGVAIAGATGATYTIPAAQVSDEASYAVRIAGSGGSIDSTLGTLTVFPLGSGPIVITARPLSRNVAPGQSVTLSITATGNGLSYQWFKNGGPIAGATASSYQIASAQAGDAATYSVRVTSGATSETATAKLTVGGQAGAGIAINSHPASQTVNPGQSVTFTVSATGTGLTYQWLKNDAQINGANSPTYTIASVQAGDAGSYTVRVSGGGQNVLSSAATLTVAGAGGGGPAARLSNLSVRTAMAADQRLIVGFFVDGGPRNILVRASGPALAALGLGGTMADPRLELYNGTTLVLSNNDWDASLAGVFTSVGAFAFPAASRDAAFQQNIQGGASVHALGTGAGLVLVEAYDTGTGNTPRMTNLSARNRVGTGDEILIAGFAISGTGDKRLLIRAAGPALGALGVDGALTDPRLELYSGSTKLTENDNWDASLAATFSSVGAFGFPAGSRDSALIATLAAGATYTVQVSGVGGGTGEGLIEIYELP
jgi:sugar lactone lactonase YvrE